MFALGWVIAAGIVGGLVSALATGFAGLVARAFSGIAVGAAQWMLVHQRLRISLAEWTAATGFGSFIIVYVQIYFGILVTKGAGNFWDLITRYGGDVVIGGTIVAVVGGLVLGLPQAAVLRDTPVRWSAWFWATMFGAIAAWLGDLCLMTLVAGDLPREARMIALGAVYWVALSIPQAVLVGRAMKSGAIRGGVCGEQPPSAISE